VRRACRKDTYFVRADSTKEIHTLATAEMLTDGAGLQVCELLGQVAEAHDAAETHALLSALCGRIVVPDTEDARDAEVQDVKHLSTEQGTGSRHVQGTQVAGGW
jgi:hypothetical protein